MTRRAVATPSRAHAPFPTAPDRDDFLPGSPRRAPNAAPLCPRTGCAIAPRPVCIPPRTPREISAAPCDQNSCVPVPSLYHIPLNMPDEERFLYWDKLGRSDDSAAIYEYLTGGLARVIDSWWISDVRSEN